MIGVMWHRSYAERLKTLQKIGMHHCQSKSTSHDGELGHARFAVNGRRTYHRIMRTGMDIKMPMRWHMPE